MNKKLSILFAALLTCTMSFALTKTTINFGSATGSCNFNAESVSYTDESRMAWTMAAVGTSSFTAYDAYSHIGSSKKPATSITMTGTAAAAMNLTSVSVKMGGFSGTAGTVTITVNGESYATGSLNESNDTIISATTAKSLAKDQTIAISVKSIAKGVKIYNITYTYEIPDVPATGITLDQSTLTLYKGTTAQLTANLTPTDATTEVVWSSSNTDVATVDNGKVTAVGEGTAIITATAGEGVSTTCNVTVVAATTKTVILDGSASELPTETATTEVSTVSQNDFTYTLSAGARTYVSTGNKKFNGTDSCVLIGKSGAYIYNNEAFGEGITKFEVYVNKGAAGTSKNNCKLSVSFSESQIKAAATSAQVITIADDNDKDSVYTLTVPTNAKYFYYTITTAHNSQVAFRITYISLPDVEATAVKLNKATTSIAQYKRDTLKANLEPANTTTAVVWSSSDESIVTVADGVVFAKAVGTAKIYAKAGNLSDSCAVTVAAATPITVDEAVKIAKTVTTNNELAAGGMYVIHGYAVSVDTTDYYKYKNYTVGMADAADETAVFSAYQVVPADGKTIVAVGDQVEVIGDITKYNTTYETVGKGAAIIQVLSQGPTTYIDNTSVETSATKKVLRNGQIFIIRDDKTYTTTGMEVK